MKTKGQVQMQKNDNEKNDLNITTMNQMKGKREYHMHNKIKDMGKQRDIFIFIYRKIFVQCQVRT